MSQYIPIVSPQLVKSPGAPLALAPQGSHSCAADAGTPATWGPHCVARGVTEKMAGSIFAFGSAYSLQNHRFPCVFSFFPTALAKICSNPF